ncbi:MAG TPA: isoprenylcysteine carboxylmethyltransferase family protein [Pyrinomonadaceae bacterium]|nr:isoprenylcysteine carboxylmethyltransferase family protein [Pyrinomonadaceae bacterium]
MRLTVLLSSLALAFFAVTFVSEKLMLRGRKVKTAVNWDRGSLALFDASGVLSVPAGIILGFTDYGRMRSGAAFVETAGLVLLVAGTALRRAAIRELWSYFTVNVSILEGQKVVRRGLYRYMRHPSYTGLLLRYLGFGLAFANWFSVALIFLPLCGATLYRIGVEEAALRERFGEEYASYARATKRLIPGIY